MALATTALACREPSTRYERTGGDPVVLQRVLDGWHEGPTDGRVCLDPQVLKQPPARGNAAMAWSDAVLAVLLVDNRVALDTSRGSTARRTPGCAPTRTTPLVSLGMPVIQKDTAWVASAASIPATGTDTGFTLRITTRLERDKTGSWRVIDNKDPYGTLVVPAR
jgi:hypothetical protein